MYFIALCDDNMEFLEIENRVIQQYMSSEGAECQIDKFIKGEDLLEVKTELKKYDLILLDVEMGETGGLETARKLRKYSDVPIAFVTAHISYSLEGYKVNAIRYILKNKDSFKNEMYECLDTVLNSSDTPAEPVICRLDTREGRIRFPIENLLYIESRHHYCYYHILENGQKKTYSQRGKLDDVIDNIQSKMLIRVHKSFLVNVVYISSMKRYQIQLKTGESIAIAQRRYLDTERAYLNYCGYIE